MKGNIYKKIKPCCPECIEELIEEKRKLGKVKEWLVCPKCGIRIVKSLYSSEIDPNRSSYLYILNNNGGKRINNGTI